MLTIIKKITDYRNIFIILPIVFILGFYINPLANVDIILWDRTFSSAVLSGISIERRISNFYKYFVVYIPFIVIVTSVTLLYLFYLRPSYRNIFFKLVLAFVPFVIASYISKYSSYSVVNDNLLLNNIIVFLLILLSLGFIDKTEKMDFSKYVILFVSLETLVIVSNLLFKSNQNSFNLILVVSTVAILIALFLIFTRLSKLYFYTFNMLLLLMWWPAFIRVCLEILYFFSEKGKVIENYFSIICFTTIIFFVFVSFATFIITNKKLDIRSFGYVGAIASFVLVAYFSFNYQYRYEYRSFSSIYELGNATVALDSIFYGKLPIIDYFSAHALSDIWTKLIYCILHNDIKGILVDPYHGLSILLSLLLLFFIFRHFFGPDFSILLIILFPFDVVGIKGITICMLSIVMLLIIMNKQTIKLYLLFWCAVLICAFVSYDEGIFLGIACIISYSVFCILKKIKKELLYFYICGLSIGAIVFLFVIVYGKHFDLIVIDRMKEWISVSVRSSSTWATDVFGDSTSFAFFFSYFICPIIAIFLAVSAIFRYCLSKTNIVLVVLIFAFALTEVLFIPRTIVFHNLAVCSGSTGVLLNFFHWTVSFYVLYRITEFKLGENAKYILFSLTLFISILIEGVSVTHYLPKPDSTLAYKTLNTSKSWNLQDNNRGNVGKQRIILGEKTQKFVNQFKTIFDVLLTKDQTFIDFSNVTSLYFFTNRIRPSYVGQTPSLLTDLYSQKEYIKEINQYDCPLAVLGTTETSYLQKMTGVPHNVRYYKIAEYIYQNYRPLVRFCEFIIWGRKDLYDNYKQILESKNFVGKGYALVDYGYDMTSIYLDNDGIKHWRFAPYHSFNLRDLPFVWANFDRFKASNNQILRTLTLSDENTYFFEGADHFRTKDGNYLSFEIISSSSVDLTTNVVLYDSHFSGAKYQLIFNVKPGRHSYLLRISQDYFWTAYNIDTIMFGNSSSLSIGNLKILKGD